MAADDLLAEVLHEPVDDVAPAVPIERPGADVHLRVVRRGRRRRVGAVAAVVVRVDVEHDERALAREVVEDAAEHGVERVVQTTRALDLLLGERLAPHVEAPRLRPASSYTHWWRGRLRSTSKRDRWTTTGSPPARVMRSVKGSSSRRRVSSSSAIRSATSGRRSWPAWMAVITSGSADAPSDQASRMAARTHRAPVAMQSVSRPLPIPPERSAFLYPSTATAGPWCRWSAGPVVESTCSWRSGSGAVVEGRRLGVRWWSSRRPVRWSTDPRGGGRALGGVTAGRGRGRGGGGQVVVELEQHGDVVLDVEHEGAGRRRSPRAQGVVDAGRPGPDRLQLGPGLGVGLRLEREHELDRERARRAAARTARCSATALFIGLTLLVVAHHQHDLERHRGGAAARGSWPARRPRCGCRPCRRSPSRARWRCR